LPLLVVKICASLGVDSGVVVADHGVVVFLRCSAPLAFPVEDVKVAGAFACTRKMR
jgi:hypothetical protein